MKTILFNFASRTRPHKFNALVDYIYANCQQPFTILAKIDDDDPTRDQYDLSRVWVAPGFSTSKIHAINRSIPDSGWDILVDISDDFVFTRGDFDMLIRHHCGPGDVLHFPEKFAEGEVVKGVNESIIIMAIMGIDYYKKFGYIFHPDYKSLFCDNELTHVSQREGAYKRIEEVVFYHAHPAAGYGKADRQTMITEAFYKQDQRTFNKRKERLFP